MASHPGLQRTVRYNHPCVAEAYFRGTGNQPSMPYDVNQIWENAMGNKGVIIPWTPPSTSKVKKASLTISDKYHVNSGTFSSDYGFQFHYNPTSIDMSYEGMPGIDPGLEVSGQDPYNLIGTGVTQSTVEFSVIINRMLDLKYFDATTGRLSKTGLHAYGTNSPPDNSTQKQIYEFGTMYDIEFLLRALIGFPMKSQLRSSFDALGTSDIGFLGAQPVEVHLGNNLRYVAFIGGMKVQHIFFDRRMVPTFSQLTLSFNRIPDYAYGSGSKNNGSGTAKAWTDSLGSIHYPDGRVSGPGGPFEQPNSPFYVNPGYVF